MSETAKRDSAFLREWIGSRRGWSVGGLDGVVIMKGERKSDPDWTMLHGGGHAYCSTCREWNDNAFGCIYVCAKRRAVARVKSNGSVTAAFEVTHREECPIGWVLQPVELPRVESFHETARLWCAALDFVANHDPRQVCCAQALDGLRALHRGADV